MTVLHLSGRITEDGRLEFELPEGLPPGEVEIAITPLAAPLPDDSDDAPLTDAEIAELLRPKAKSGAEIARSEAIGAWADYGITDPVTWVEAQRRKHSARRGW
ncbi:MAG: hypothetical protein JW910_11895 [Anaerolineae bacterium]|nr:hypothetical protein [Anaerolineae bacterium]